MTAAQSSSSSLQVATLASALGRAGYGPVPGQLARVARQGWGGWVEEQLAPNDDNDPRLKPRLANMMLRIRHGAGETWPAVDEIRPPMFIDKPLEALWPLATGKAKMDASERRRPRDEAIAATVLRAVHSQWQVKEVLTAFWHDHFNVDFFQSDLLAPLLPSWDRDVIRANALGNFRAFLEAEATHPAMLIYLSNRSSRAGAANENFARELFELHTMGRDAYLNDRYDRWRDVPGAMEGRPAGYIDQDVYEAARALTGWTVEDGGGIDGKRKLADSGRFVYVEAWHDGYQKRVLGNEFQPFAAAQADGRKVLDLVAEHPATARFVCSKLVRRLVGASSPKLVGAASAEWLKSVHAPDQIGRVVRLILMSHEFMAATGARVKRPLAVAAGFARATGLDLLPTEGLYNGIAAAGQRLFAWPTPTGLPDEDAQFLGTQALRQRWALLLGLAENWWGTGLIPVPESLNSAQPTAATAVTAWSETLLGAENSAVTDAVLAGWGAPPDQPLGKPDSPDTAKKLARIAAFVAMAPAWQSA